jgi:hypothetical protein
VSTTVDIPEPAPTQPARAPEPPEQPRLPPGATWDLDRVLARDPLACPSSPQAARLCL